MSTFKNTYTCICTYIYVRRDSMPIQVHVPTNLHSRANVHTYMRRARQVAQASRAIVSMLTTAPTARISCTRRANMILKLRTLSLLREVATFCLRVPRGHVHAMRATAKSYVNHIRFATHMFWAYKGWPLFACARHGDIYTWSADVYIHL